MAENELLQMHDLKPARVPRRTASVWAVVKAPRVRPLVVAQGPDEAYARSSGL